MKSKWQVVRTLCFVVSCSGCGEDNAYIAGATYHIGAPVADVVSQAGAPTMERSVNARDENDLCNRYGDHDAVRALEYHLPARGFSHYVRQAIGAGPSMIITVCVNSSQVVTDIHQVIVD